MINTNFNINIFYDYNLGWYIASMPEIKGLAVTASSQTASLAALIATASSSFWPDPVMPPMTQRSGEYGPTVKNGVTSSNGALITVTLAGINGGFNGTSSATYSTIIPLNPNFI